MTTGCGNQGTCTTYLVGMGRKYCLQVIVSWWSTIDHLLYFNFIMKLLVDSVAIQKKIDATIWQLTIF